MQECYKKKKIVKVHVLNTNENIANMNQTSNTQASYLENISSDHHMIDDNNPQIIEDDGRFNLQSSENLNIIKDKILR